MSTLRDKIKSLEKDEISSALSECNWVMAKAARKLGITERMIGYKIKKYGLRKEDVIGKENVCKENKDGSEQN
ncbi:MAG TPA: hypothetical protein HPP56_05865 [Nitrospirae bacterium]|nr:hypothetical protein [Nitrospirota bacterium]